MQPQKYLTVFNLGIQNTFVYRWNYLLRAIFGLIPLVGTIFLWRAIFRESGGGMRGYDYGSMIYYYLLTILVSNLVTPTEDEWQIAADIREGQINSFLTKPMSYLGYRFSIFLSGRLVYTAVTILPIAAIFFYFRHFIILPNDAVTWLAAIVSLVMSALIQFFLTYSLSMMAFWILEISTIVFIVYSFEYFLGGQMFPLDIMPPAIQAVMKWLPFYYELFCPIAIFQGRLRGGRNAGRTRHPVRLDAGDVGRGQLDVETRARPLSGSRRLTNLGREISIAQRHATFQIRDTVDLKALSLSAPKRGRSRARSFPAQGLDQAGHDSQGDALLAFRRRQTSPPDPLSGRGRGLRRPNEKRASPRLRGRVHPHLLAHPRRSPEHGQRRFPARSRDLSQGFWRRHRGSGG